MSLDKNKKKVFDNKKYVILYLCSPSIPIPYRNAQHRSRFYRDELQREEVTLCQQKRKPQRKR